MNVRFFIDFWNFQLSWNERTNNAKCDWTKIPEVFINETKKELARSGIKEPLYFQEARIYASYSEQSSHSPALLTWLDTFLNRLPGFRVFTSKRIDTVNYVHCQICGNEIQKCPSCQAPLYKSQEKGVDVSLATDLTTLAWENAYEIGILISSDNDFIPVVTRLQDMGFKIINLVWKDHYTELARTCWATLSMTHIIPLLIRQQSRKASNGDDSPYHPH